MSIRAKAFPYPVLSTFSNDYLGDTHPDLEATGRVLDGSDQAVEIEYKVTIGSQWMDEYVLDGGADVFLDIYCRSTLHRQIARLQKLDGVISFEEGALAGSVELSMIIAARADDDFAPEGINPEFGPGPFKVAEGDMLGIGPTVIVDLDFDRTLQTDLITLALVPDMDDDVYAFQPGPERIVIRAGKTAHRAISRMLHDRTLSPYLHMSVFKDCVADALQYLIENGGHENDVPWGRHLIAAIEKHGLDPFGDETVEHTDEIAQRLMAQQGVRKVAVIND